MLRAELTSSYEEVKAFLRMPLDWTSANNPTGCITIYTGKQLAPVGANCYNVRLNNDNNVRSFQISEVLNNFDSTALSSKVFICIDAQRIYRY